MEHLKAAAAQLRETIRLSKSRRRKEVVPYLVSRGWVPDGYRYRNPRIDRLEVVGSAMHTQRVWDVDELLKAVDQATEAMATG